MFLVHRWQALPLSVNGHIHECKSMQFVTWVTRGSGPVGKPGPASNLPPQFSPRTRMILRMMWRFTGGIALIRRITARVPANCMAPDTGL
jgi:hypothetical protein